MGRYCHSGSNAVQSEFNNATCQTIGGLYQTLHSFSQFTTESNSFLMAQNYQDDFAVQGFLAQIWYHRMTGPFVNVCFLHRKIGAIWA